MSRSRELFDAVDRFTRTHNAWVDDQNSPFPTLSYWEGCDQLLSTFDTGDIPRDCRQLAAAVYELGTERLMFVQADNANPPDSFWAKREALESLMTRIRHGKIKPYRESVKDLKAQGVPDEQIARIWGLTHPDGSGNQHLVRRELEFPGSVIGPDYVHPDDKEPEDKVALARSRYATLREKSAPAVQADDDGPCPESSEDLWMQGVAVSQAAQMLKRPEKDVAAEWAEYQRGRMGRQESAKQAEQQPAKPQFTGVMAERRPKPQFDDPILPSDDAVATPEVPEDSPYAPFSEWSDDEIKGHAKRIGVDIRGKFKRERLIDRILAAEHANAEMEPESAAEPTDEPDAEDEDAGLVETDSMPQEIAQ